MRKVNFYILILLVGCFSFATRAQLPKVTLSESSKVSLLTCSQGEELYSIFGHSAIRVTDQSNGIDWVFNYGTFDFSDPNFYPNFVKGKLNYILSVSTYKNFEYAYKHEGRAIYEQTLNIHLFERQKLLDSLAINHLPENRYYLYDFLFDNCATRIRDILVEAIPRKISFDYSPLQAKRSFRDLLMPNVSSMPWAKLGINLLLGVKADRIAEPWEYMFLPEHMLTVFGSARIASPSGEEALTQSLHTLLKPTGISSEPKLNTPLLVFIGVLILAAGITFFDMKRRRRSSWFDAITFTMVGLLGCVIAFQWFGSDHAVMANNYNLLWAHPIHVVAIVALAFRSTRYATKLYFGANAVALCLLLMLWFFLPQTLPLPMLPLVGAMALRSAYIYKYLQGKVG